MNKSNTAKLNIVYSITGQLFSHGRHVMKLLFGSVAIFFCEYNSYYELSRRYINTTTVCFSYAHFVNYTPFVTFPSSRSPRHTPFITLPSLHFLRHTSFITFPLSCSLRYGSFAALPLLRFRQCTTFCYAPSLMLPPLRSLCYYLLSPLILSLR